MTTFHLGVKWPFKSQKPEKNEAKTVTKKVKEGHKNSYTASAGNMVIQRNNLDFTLFSVGVE